MIDINLENPVVLRRALEDLDRRTVVVRTPVASVEELPLAALAPDAILKINELVVVVNSISTILNSTQKV